MRRVYPSVLPGTELIVTSSEEDFRVGYVGSLVIGVWPGRATVDHMELFRQAELEAIKQTDVLNLIIMLRILGGGIAPEIRAKGEAMQREFAEQLVGQAIVLVGSGLLAATVRAFAGGLNLLSRARVQTSTFGRPDQALEWLATRKRQTPETAEHLRSLVPVVDAFTRDLYGEAAE